MTTPSKCSIDINTIRLDRQGIDGFIYYRPVITGMVTSFSTELDEWGAVTSWSLELAEV